MDGKNVDVATTAMGHSILCFGWFTLGHLGYLHARGGVGTWTLDDWLFCA